MATTANATQSVGSGSRGGGGGGGVDGGNDYNKSRTLMKDDRLSCTNKTKAREKVEAA